MHRILIVDDDENILNGLRRLLRKFGEIETCADPMTAVKTVREKGPFSLVICDQQMPGANGVSFLREYRKRAPETVRIMLTGDMARATAMGAVNEGSVYRLLTKPCPSAELISTVQEGLQFFERQQAERTLLEQTLAGSVRVLTEVLALSDPDAFTLTSRMRKWGERLVKVMPELNAWELDIAIMLSPLGQALLPDDFKIKLRSGQTLNEKERDVISRTAQTAHDLIVSIPRLEPVATAVLLQGKGLDGSGFPKDHNEPDQIPLLARALKIIRDLAGCTPDDWPNEKAFAKLRTREAQYDHVILDQLESTLKDQSADESQQQVAERIQATVSQLRAGDRLNSDIKTKEGRMILNSGQELTDAFIRRIREIHSLTPISEPMMIVRLQNKSASKAA